ncbi:MAG: universal stress protein [Deltaproteobacteria bacterium]|nr:universal stress protein [Deltaproteobacteria bacterium]
MAKLNRIIVAVDFSKCSKKAIEEASLLAEKLHSNITLVHAMESFSEYALSPVFLYSDSSYVKESMDRYAQDQGKKLSKIAKSLGEKNHISVDYKIAVGNAHEVILREAKKLKADIIVMGTHGHSGLDHLLMGSTAERVLRKAGCPVLTVKPSK